MWNDYPTNTRDNFTQTYLNSNVSSSPVSKNPFTYRGYYYDRDLGLYYLNSRYYDSNTGRFISPDDASYLGANGDINSYNLYAYCSNNPVMYQDPSGHSIIGAIVIGAVIGVVAQYVSDVINNIASGETGEDILKPTSSITDYVASGVGGAIAAIPLGGFVGSLITGAVGNIATDIIKKDITSAQDLVVSGLFGAAANGVGYTLSKYLSKIKVGEINEMNRASKKNYLTDKIFKNSRANANLHTFMDNPYGIVEKSFAVFKYGIYSTISSTSLLTIKGWLKVWII